MFKFNSDKTLLKPSELIKNLSISKAQFYRFINKWILKGITLEEMGKVKVGRLVLWNGQQFLDCLIKYENETTPKYDYEIKDKKLATLIVSKYDSRQTNT